MLTVQETDGLQQSSRRKGAFISFSSASSTSGEGSMSADEEIMEELITLSWDAIEDFSNKVERYRL